MPSYSVFIDKKAKKQLGKLPKKMQDRIGKAIDTLQDEGFSKNLDIKKLQGLPYKYRVRVGKYRILLELRADDLIEVYAILPRETAYNQT